MSSLLQNPVFTFFPPLDVTAPSSHQFVPRVGCFLTFYPTFAKILYGKDDPLVFIHRFYQISDTLSSTNQVFTSEKFLFASYST